MSGLAVGESSADLLPEAEADGGDDEEEEGFNAQYQFSRKKTIWSKKSQPQKVRAAQTPHLNLLFGAWFGIVWVVPDCHRFWVWLGFQIPF